MPSYYNPYGYMPMNSYATGTGYGQQMSGAQQVKAMEWVEGEVGAKAYQMPQGWPANQPIPLWDSTDTVIFLKSWSPMGIPNPMQKIHYEMPESQSLLSGAANPQVDTTRFATKEDMQQLKEELKALIQNGRNQR